MAADNKNNRELSLGDLLDIKKWQKIQDNFSAVTGVGLRTVDLHGHLLVSPSGEYPLCREMLKDSTKKEIQTGCLPTFLGGQEIVDKNLDFICKAGLHNSVAPLRLNNQKVLGYLVVGPVVLVMRKPKEEYRKVAEELNMNLEDFWNALLGVKVLSFHGIKSLLELIQDVGEYTLNLAYKNIIERKGLAVSTAPDKLRQLLDTLLDVVFEVSGADIGSVMFMDKDTKELTIHASRGIPEEIVSRTRVKVGEGISGIAAKDGEAFLIDEGPQTSNRIRPYLNRPYISSSMVLPLKVENKVMGVMNVGALKTSPVRFTSDNLNLVNRLIDMATVAIRA